MDPTKSPRSKRSSRTFTPMDKVHIIHRIKNGETKAAVSRDMGVPESTLRGWCKNEQKLRYMCSQMGYDPDKVATKTFVVPIPATSYNYNVTPVTVTDFFDLPSTSQGARNLQMQKPLQNSSSMRPTSNAAQFKELTISERQYSQDTRNTFMKYADLAKKLAAKSPTDKKPDNSSVSKASVLPEKEPISNSEVFKVVFPNGLPPVPIEGDRSTLFEWCRLFNRGIDFLALAAATASLQYRKRDVNNSNEERNLETQRAESPPVIASTSAAAAAAAAGEVNNLATQFGAQYTNQFGGQYTSQFAAPSTSKAATQFVAPHSKQRYNNAQSFTQNAALFASQFGAQSTTQYGVQSSASSSSQSDTLANSQFATPYAFKSGAEYNTQFAAKPVTAITATTGGQSADQNVASYATQHTTQVATASTSQSGAQSTTQSAPNIFRVPDYFPYKPVKRTPPGTATRTNQSYPDKKPSTFSPYECWPESSSKRPRLSQLSNLSRFRN